jgi:hypothetical protein
VGREVRGGFPRCEAVLELLDEQAAFEGLLQVGEGQGLAVELGPRGLRGGEAVLPAECVGGALQFLGRDGQAGGAGGVERSVLGQRLQQQRQ